MKKIILIVVATILSVIIAAKMGLFSALFMLFLVGIIPGTHIIIPANVMLLMISAAMCAILFLPTAKEILHIVFEYHSTKHHKVKRTHLPKRRFSEI